MNARPIFAVVRTFLVVTALVPLGLAGEADAAKVIRIGHSEGFETPHGQTIAIFKKHVEDASDGNLQVEIFPNLQLGSVIEQIEGVKIGTQEMFISTPAWFSRFYDPIDVLSMPYLVTDWDSAEQMLSSPVLTDLFADAEEASGIKVLGTFALGFRNANTNRRPITTAEDWVGLKIRIQNSPVYIALMEAFGANPTPMDPGELYQALQTGVVDGHETTIPIMLSANYHEVATYVSLTQHTFEVFLVYINQPFFDGLSSEEQKIIEDAMQAAATAGFVIARAAEVTALRGLAAAGAQVNRLPDAEAAHLASLVEPVYDRLSSRFEPHLSNLRQAAVRAAAE